MRLALCLSLSLLACDTDPPPPGPAPITTPSGPVQTARAQPEGEQWPGMYAPKRVYQVDRPRVETLSDADALIAPRKIQVAIYQPSDADTPAPVVVMSPGGGALDDPALSLTRWAYRIAKAGYVTVAIAHPARSEAERKAICDKWRRDDCDPLSWDRAHDVVTVLDALEKVATVDTQRMVVVGYGDGADAALMLAGAKRSYAGEPLDLSDPRPKGFVLLSPRGPGRDGFDEAAWADVARPLLMATGTGDTAAVPLTARRKAFDSLGAGDKYLLHLAHDAAHESIFEGDLAACQKHPKGRGDTCQQLVRLIHSPMLAFFDALLRDDAEARAYLKSQKLEAASRGKAVWYLK